MLNVLDASFQDDVSYCLRVDINIPGFSLVLCHLSGSSCVTDVATEPCRLQTLLTSVPDSVAILTPSTFAVA